MRLGKTITWLVCGLAFLTPTAWAQAPQIHSFELSWQEAVVGQPIYTNVDKDTPAFSIEPDWDGRQVWRGHLIFDPPSTKTIKVPLIWDRSAHKLYIDLNRDSDLPNDPNGILTAQGDPRYFHNFPAFQIELPSSQGTFRYQLSPEIYSYQKRDCQQLTVRGPRFIGIQRDNQSPRNRMVSVGQRWAPWVYRASKPLEHPKQRS